MKPIVKTSTRNRAFTIIELLTVMSIIIILIGILVPGLNMVKRFAKKVTQKNQFHTIEVAMETYNAEWQDYPPSGAIDDDGTEYCGAMKLAEAMVGQDLLGFHPNSRFNYPDLALYPKPTPPSIDLSSRRAYLKAESAHAFKLKDLFSASTPFDPENIVLCDEYANVTHKMTGKLVGMPVLYYKANIANNKHDAADPAGSIYNYLDNNNLVSQPWLPGASAGAHRLTTAGRFYEMTLNPEASDLIAGFLRPYRADSYILLSAGFDGEYGTDDDVCNFGN